MKILRFKIRKIRSQANERGSAIIEFSMVAPVLIMLCLSVFDLGGALCNYMVLSQVAGEGVRLGTERAGLEEVTVDTTSASVAASYGSAGHYVVHRKVHSLLNMQNLKLSQLSVQSSYARAGDSSSGLPEKTVSVTVSGEYNGILPFFKHLSLKAQKSGAYLF